MKDALKWEKPAVDVHKLAHTATDIHHSMLTVTDMHFMDTSQTQALSQTHLPITATPIHTDVYALTDTPRDTCRHNHNHQRHTCSLCKFLHHMSTEAYHGHTHSISHSLKHIITNSHGLQA